MARGQDAGGHVGGFYCSGERLGEAPYLGEEVGEIVQTRYHGPVVAL